MAGFTKGYQVFVYVFVPKVPIVEVVALQGVGNRSPTSAHLTNMPVNLHTLVGFFLPFGACDIC